MMSERSIYTEKEKLCLQELIRKYGLHLNSKFLGKFTAKQEAWANLTAEFNSIKGNSRRVEAQLRKCWSNLRNRKKAILEAEKTERLRIEQTTEGLNESERTNNHHCSCSGVADGRARPFFTEREKVYLQGLVRKYGLQQNSTFLGSVAAKRQAWVRLAKEFNSKECNTRRSEIQLRKCWENLKTRKRNLLARIKRERLQTEVEPSHPEVEIPYAVAEEVEDPLDSTNDVKLRVEFQAMPEPAPADALEVLPPEVVQEQMAIALNIKSEPPHSSAPSSVFGDNDDTNTQEYQRVNSKRIEEREEELHRLQVEEKRWLVKAAEEAYIKARLERESAEELLRFRKAKREEAERKMNKD